MNRWEQIRINELEQEIAVMEIVSPGGTHLQDIQDKCKQKEGMQMTSPQTVRNVLIRLEEKGFIRRHSKNIKSGMYYLVPQGIDTLPLERQKLKELKEKAKDTKETWRPGKEYTPVNTKVKIGDVIVSGSGWHEEEHERTSKGKIPAGAREETEEVVREAVQVLNKLPPSTKKFQFHYARD